jgi:LuxR family maltose regulon positive regulatory protein
MLRRFPAVQLDTDAALQLIQAWALSFCGAHDEAARTMDHLEASFMLDAGPVAGFSCLESGLRLLRAVFPNGDVGLQLENGQRAAELEDQQSAWWPVGQYALGVGSYFAGDVAEADAYFQIAQLSGLPSGQAVTVATAIAYRSLISGDLGDVAEQQRLAAEADEFALEHGLTHPLGAVHVAAGVAAAARGDHQVALARLEEGVAFIRTWGEPLILAHALIRLGGVLIALGEPAKASSILDEAESIIAGCSDPGTLRDRIAELGNPAPPHAVSGSSLTARERDVLRRLDSGDSEAEIATALFVSFNTLHSHVRSVYRKLGVTSRQEAVARTESIDDE